jgi:nucleoside-diphosphate-sugar epimerase
MRILLTGHKGYIGAALTRILLEADHEVHRLDSDLFRRCTFGEPLPAIPESCKDIRDVEMNDLRGCDAEHLIEMRGLNSSSRVIDAASEQWLIRRAFRCTKQPT